MPVFLAEDALQVALFDGRLQPVDYKERGREQQGLGGPAGERRAEQRDAPTDYLRVAGEAVGTALYKVSRLEAGHLLEGTKLVHAGPE